MINKLIQKAKNLWLTDISEEQAKEILDKYPDILGSYYKQKELFGGDNIK